jgi:hypothetical protein
VLKKSSIPILFYHVGDFWKVGAKRFLDTALCQATLASPNSDVILLTDEIRQLSFDVQQVQVREYFSESALSFQKVYVHMSISNELYELHCYIRWFVIREFVRRHGIQHFCVFDSDVLLFSSVERFASEFAGYAAGNWAWANYFSGLTALDAMCEYFYRVFLDRQFLIQLAERKRAMLGKAHVSDMNMLTELAKSNASFLDQSDFPNRGFDHNVRDSENGIYIMDGGIKLLTEGQNGTWNARRSQDHAPVPFHFLHFQGPSKQLMGMFAWKVPAESEIIYKIARNQLCPCLSGKRWKHCHGRLVGSPTS